MMQESNPLIDLWLWLPAAQIWMSFLGRVIIHRSLLRPSFSARRFTMSALETLAQEIETQKALFNGLREQKAETSVLDEAKKKLADLQKQMGLAKAASGSKEASSKKSAPRILLKTGKVRAWLPFCGN
jgi:hypothetical protein